MILAFAIVHMGTTESTHTRSRVFLSGQARMVVEGAIAGAQRRLASSDCRRLFEEFHDAGGRTLQSHLIAAGRDAGEHLSLVVFADGDGTPQCRQWDSTAMFAEPGSRVVHVCTRRMVRAYRLRADSAEILVIHELLHTLGLGENPPTADAITKHVRDRCSS